MLTLVICIMSMPLTSAASGVPHEMRQMGQVQIHFSHLYVGSEGFDMYLNLNGYIPKTVSMTMSGDFTEEEMQAAFDSGSCIKERISPVIPRPELYSEAAVTLESINDIRNGLFGKLYPKNVETLSQTWTSVEYSIIPPDNEPLNGMSVQAIGSSVELQSGGETRQVTRKIYMDGQLIVEYTCKTSPSGSARVLSYTVYDAEFKAD